MKRILTILIAASLATPAMAEWNEINSKRELAKYVVGKNFVEPKTKTWFQLRSNGSLVGGTKSGKLTGSWEWKRGRVCFDRQLAGKTLPSDCITINVDGDELTTTRRSNGRTTLYERAKK